MGSETRLLYTEAHTLPTLLSERLYLLRSICYSHFKLRLEIMPSWTDIVVSFITLQLAYIVYAVISRVFLSHLRSIPGPKLAAITSWYEFYFDAIQPGRFVWKIKDLHSEYGLTFSLRGKLWSLIHVLRRSHRANYPLGGPCERRQLFR